MDNNTTTLSSMQSAHSAAKRRLARALLPPATHQVQVLAPRHDRQNGHVLVHRRRTMAITTQVKKMTVAQSGAATTRAS